MGDGKIRANPEALNGIDSVISNGTIRSTTTTVFTKGNNERQYSMDADQSVWFIETKRFSSLWEDLKLSVEDLMLLQDAIKTDPTMHPVISGTGGLRKMRFAPPSLRKGKRGSFRVCFAFFPKFAAIVLVLVFAKNEQVDLTGDDKKSVKKWLQELEIEFTRRFN